MAQKNIKLFIDEVYAKPPEENYTTNKTDFYNIDDIRSLDIFRLERKQ